MVWLYWLTAAASIAGVVLNIRRRRACFAVWLCTNTTWCVVDALHGLPQQSVVFAVYAALSVHGWRTWAPRPRVVNPVEVLEPIVVRGPRRWTINWRVRDRSLFTTRPPERAGPGKPDALRRRDAGRFLGRGGPR